MECVTILCRSKNMSWWWSGEEVISCGSRGSDHVICIPLLAIYIGSGISCVVSPLTQNKAVVRDLIEVH